MYKQHKLYILIIFIIVFIISFVFKLNYKKIASDVISVVAIFIAVYAISISSLIGSKLSKKMKDRDYKYPNKTKIGILSMYYKNANLVAVITIVLSCIVNFLFEEDIEKYKTFIYLFLSTCNAFFSINFIFVLLIIKFILDVQLMEDED